MAQLQPNVVQAEFFHVQLADTTLNKVLSECSERWMEDSRIKTVVRFYDDYGFVTDFVSEVRDLELRQQNVRLAMPSAWPLEKYFLGRKSRSLAGKMSEARKRATGLLAERVDKVINTDGKIAVERPDHSFRWAQGEELHELGEATGKATAVMIFLFQHNDLLAEINSPAGHFI